MSQPSLSFADLNLSKPVMDALKRIGYEQPSPIQAEAIPHLLNGEDLLGTAQTGTGKTAAFALPLLSRIDLKKNKPQVLVLAPTRELAIQVAEAFQNYASAMKGFHVLPIYGGQDISGQLRQLRRGAHVVVGTPGRVMDHLRRKTLVLDELQTLVLDEADEMLRMGFIDDVTWILEHTPDNHQIALFSATMPKPIKRIADTYLTNPKEVKIEGKTTTVDNIEQVYWTVTGVKKLDALTRILEVEEFDGIIMFVRTKTLTVELADKLAARGYRASAINGDMSQTLRERTISQLKSGKIDILVATDVAARGIDVARISHVINYDIPYDTEAYVHRIGRTGRAGRSGKAILFVAPRERRLLRAIEKATRQTIKSIELPSREQVNKKRTGQFKEEIAKTLEFVKLEFFQSMVQEFMDESSADPLQLAAALAFMAQKGNPILVAEDKHRRTESPANEEGYGQKDKHRERSRGKDRGEGGRDGGRDKRPARDGRPDRKAKKIFDETGEEVTMETFRIAVGHNHNAQPGDIVGAIANEAGVESSFIGRIKLNDDYSTIDLPSGMPNEVFNHLKKVRVRNHPLDIERLDGSSPAPKKSKEKSKDKKDAKKKPKRKDAVGAKKKAPAKKRKSNADTDSE